MQHCARCLLSWQPLGDCLCMQVGKAGQVTGIDCKGRAIALARKSVSTLELAGGRYQQLAGAVTLKQHNVFLPASFLTVCPMLLDVPVQEMGRACLPQPHLPQPHLHQH